MISIIVPVYNDENNIESCVSSLMAQAYEDIEILLVDDGSEDNSGKICDGLCKKDKRIRAFHIKNSGVSHARNIGIERAAGEYVVFCDSDDTLQPNYCSTLMQYASEENIVVCAFRYGESRIFKFSDNAFDLLEKSRFFSLYNRQLINAPVNKLYLREKLLKNSIHFDETLDLGEDLLFNLEYLSCCEKILVINEPLYNYQPVQNSLSRKYRKDMYEIQIRLFTAIERFRIDENIAAEEEYNMMYMQLINRVIRNNMLAESGRSLWGRLRQNNEILRADPIIKSMKQSEFKNAGKLFLKVYKSGSCIAVLAYLWLSKLKTKLLHNKNI